VQSGIDFTSHVRLIANPHAAVAAPDWITATIEEYRAQCRQQFGQPD
jgi:hypothetical protein